MVFDVKPIVTGKGSVLVSFNSLTNLLPDHLSLKGHEWIRKRELHVTLIDGRHGVCNFHRLVDIVRTIAFKVTVKQAIYQVAKLYSSPHTHLRHSIIIGCAVEGAEEFYQTVYEKTGMLISGVPHHITLYTTDDSQSKGGIGLINQDELQQYAVPLEISTLPLDLRKAITLIVPRTPASI